MNDDLREQLHRAADDIDFDVPDLRSRAKTARRRRRLLGGTTALAGVAIAAALITPQLSVLRAVPAESRTADPTPTAPSPSPTAPPTQTEPSVEHTPGPQPVVPHDEIVSNCMHQLGASIARYGPVPDDLRVAHDRDYREGDIVRLVSDSSWDPSALCIIPNPATHPSLSIRDTLRETTSDIAPVVCSELMTAETPSGPSYDTVDLRRATVITLMGEVDEDTSLWHAILDQGGEWYSCGWFFRPDGTVDFFGQDEPVERRDQSVPGSSLVFTWSEWDGVSPTAPAVAWGEYGEAIAELRLDNAGDGGLTRFSNENGVFQAIVELRPVGTAEHWSSDTVEISGIDERGDYVFSNGFAIGGLPDIEE